jgi:hypothetical protein
MIVFLFRPSPQVPRPSTRAAIQCYEACEYNIYMQRDQITKGNVDLTWAFTQSLFMAINTILWSLSYSEVRRQHPREVVQQHLNMALEAIIHASERWPGVASAAELYETLIDGCMKMYNKDGDVPITAGSPSPSPSFLHQDLPSSSPSTSPFASTTRSHVPSPEQGHQVQEYAASQPSTTNRSGSSPSVYQTSPRSVASAPRSTSDPLLNPHFANVSNIRFDPSSQYNALPDTLPELVPWNDAYAISQGQYPFVSMAPPKHGVQQPREISPFNTLPASTAPGMDFSSATQYANYLSQPAWSTDRSQMVGIDQAQQVELLQSLETDGIGQVESMIQASNAIFNRIER